MKSTAAGRTSKGKKKYESLERDAGTSGRLSRPRGGTVRREEGSSSSHLGKPTSELSARSRSQTSGTPSLTKKTSTDDKGKSLPQSRARLESSTSSQTDAGVLSGSTKSRDVASCSSESTTKASSLRKQRSVTLTVKERMQQFDKSTESKSDVTNPTKVERPVVTRKRSIQLLNLLGRFESQSSDAKVTSPQQESPSTSMRKTTISKSYNDVSATMLCDKPDVDLPHAGVIASSGNSTSLSLTDVSSAGRHIPSDAPSAGEQARRKGATDDVPQRLHRRRRRSSSCDGSDLHMSPSQSTTATTESEVRDSPAEEDNDTLVKSPTSNRTEVTSPSAAGSESRPVEGRRRSSCSEADGECCTRTRRSSSSSRKVARQDGEEKTTVASSSRKSSARGSVRSDGSSATISVAGRTSPSSRRRSSTDSVKSSKSSASRKKSDVGGTGSGRTSPASRRSSPTKADSRGRVGSTGSGVLSGRASSGSATSTTGPYSPSARHRSATFEASPAATATSRSPVKSTSSSCVSSRTSSTNSRTSSTDTQPQTKTSTARKDSSTSLSRRSSQTSVASTSRRSSATSEATDTQSQTKTSTARKDSSTSLSRRSSQTSMASTSRRSLAPSEATDTQPQTKTSTARKDSSTSLSRRSSQTSVSSTSRRSSATSEASGAASETTSGKSSPKSDSRATKKSVSPVSRQSSQRDRQRSSPTSGRRAGDIAEKKPSRSSSKSSVAANSPGAESPLLGNSRKQSSDDIFGDIGIDSKRMTTHMQQHRIHVAPGGRRKFTMNPIRALNDRADVVSELTPSSPSASQAFSKSAQLAGMNVSLSACALAGLASKEDVTSVKLTSVSDVGSTNWPKVLLLRIKGRRNLQVRVVEPKASSVNSGDSFILVNSEKRCVYQFIGKTANVVERAKSADLLKDVVHGKDCGSRSASAIIVEEGKISSRSTEGQFWSALSAKDSRPSDIPAEDGDDVVVEKELISQIVVYEVSEDKLILCKDLSGKSLKYAMFDSKKVYIFDFVNEVASWTGRRAPNAVRKKASQLVKDVFERGYIGKEGGRANSARPSWALLMNCKEGSESVLFRCKVQDWPDPGKVIQAKNVGYTNVVQSSKLVPCSAKDMHQSSSPYPGLKVLQRNLGRGRGEAPRDDPCLPGVIVRTESIKKWLVKDNSCQEVPEATYCDFYEGDVYIVRWTYSLHAERSNLKGEVQSKQVGSDQVVYFFWQGSKCRTSEKGASALIVVELAASEGDPQVRVVQGSEPPAFLQMFDGGMTVHCGSFKSPSDSDVHLYALHGLIEHETHLEELPSPVQHDHLRCRHSFLVVKASSSQLYVWHGESSPPKVRSLAASVAEKLSARQNADNQAAICSEVPAITEIRQGVDCSALKTVIRGYQVSGLWDEGLVLGSTAGPRMYLFSVSSGAFTFNHIERDWRHDNHHTTYPASQALFYEARQPAIGLVQAAHELFVWCGWLPEQSEDERSVGSLKSQFVETKKLAFETASSYLEEMKRSGLSECRALVITAGYEPERFRSLFLHWTESAEAVTSVCKIKPCSQLEPVALHQEMDSMKGATYPLELLRSKPLPEDLDVDPKALEQYLSDSDFKIAFSRTREDFSSLPAWKQVNLRKQAGLF